MQQQFILFLKNEKFSYVVAKNGEVEQSFFPGQRHTREEEQLFRAGTDGVVEYYYPERRALPKSTLVCSILDDYYDLLNESSRTSTGRWMASRAARNTWTEFKQERSGYRVNSGAVSAVKKDDLQFFSQVYDVKKESLGDRRSQGARTSLCFVQNKRITLQEKGGHTNAAGGEQELLYLSEA